jgi:hypothetical protein
MKFHRAFFLLIMVTLLASAFSVASATEGTITIDTEIIKRTTTSQSNPLNNVPGPNFFLPGSDYEVDIYFFGTTSLANDKKTPVGTFNGKDYYEHDSNVLTVPFVVKANFSGIHETVVPKYVYADPMFNYTFPESQLNTEAVSQRGAGWGTFNQITDERYAEYSVTDLSGDGFNLTVNNYDKIYAVEFHNVTAGTVTTLTQWTNATTMVNMTATNFFWYDTNRAMADVLRFNQSFVNSWNNNVNETLIIRGTEFYNFDFDASTHPDITTNEALEIDSVYITRIYNATLNETVMVDFNYTNLRESSANTVSIWDNLHINDTVQIFFYGAKGTTLNPQIDETWTHKVTGQVYLLYDGQAFPTTSVSSFTDSGFVAILPQGFHYLTVLYIATLDNGTHIYGYDTLYVQIAPAGQHVDPTTAALQLPASLSYTDTFNSSTLYDQDTALVAPHNGPREMSGDIKFGTTDYELGGPFVHAPGYYVNGTDEFDLDFTVDSSGSLLVVDDILNDGTDWVGNDNATNVIPGSERRAVYDGAFDFQYQYKLTGTPVAQGISFFFDDFGIRAVPTGEIEINAVAGAGTTKFGVLTFVPQGIVHRNFLTANNAFSVHTGGSSANYSNIYGHGVIKGEMQVEDFDLQAYYDAFIDDVHESFASSPKTPVITDKDYNSDTQTFTMSWTHTDLTAEDFKEFEKEVSFLGFMGEYLDFVDVEQMVKDDTNIPDSVLDITTSTEFIAAYIDPYLATITADRDGTAVTVTGNSITDDLSAVLVEGENTIVYTIKATNDYGETTTVYTLSVNVTTGSFLNVNFFIPAFALFVAIPLIRKLRK